MEPTMKLRNIILGTVAGAGALMALSTSASAYLACNREGDCWHTETRYSQPGVSFEYHPDDWYFHRHWDGDRSDRYHYRAWRDDSAHGYWRNGVWITF
jgi:hypothetical protein